MNLSYSEIIKIPTYEERLKYLKLGSRIGDMTFNGSRWMNQEFYRSRQWRDVRNAVIVRDSCCDLAHPDYPIMDGSLVRIHHINTISIDDLVNEVYDQLLNPENLICVTLQTHNAIHYGNGSPYHKVTERYPNDTCPWR